MFTRHQEIGKIGDFINKGGVINANHSKEKER